MNYGLNEISTVADKHGANATEIAHSFTYYLEVATALAKYDDGESLEQVEAAYRDEVVHKMQFEASRDTLRSMVERISSGRLGQADTENVAQMYIDMQKETSISKEKKIDKGEEMVTFKRAVWEVAHPDEPFMLSGDDDIAVMASTNQKFICPITTMLLEEPVKNTCGHIFSKAAVSGYLRHNRGNAPCPVAGCPARVTSKTLVDDEVTKHKMEQSKKRKRTEPQKEVEDL